MANRRQKACGATASPSDGTGGSAVQAAFERQVLRGLIAEWEQARGMLTQKLRASLRRPLFAIRDMPVRLGSWSLLKREITLSRALVSRHRWDDIRDVLLHEMAHQLAHEGFMAARERDHGRHFQQACRLLGADPSASGSLRSLRDRLRDGEAIDDRDRMVLRIRKLMALAESSNPHEAHAAMRKAHQLIARHQVDLIRSGIDQDYASLFVGTPRLRHFRETYQLAHLLQDFYFVQGVWVQAWVLEKARMGRVLEISGTRKNILIAEYVHDSVHRYIDSAWENYRAGKALNRYRKTDFAVGIIEGFRSTLLQAVSDGPPTAGNNLPAPIEDRGLTRYLKGRYPRLRSYSKRGSAHDSRILAAGVKQGRKLVIAKGITLKDGFRHRALTDPAESA